MKWEFGFLSQVELGLMGLLMGIGLGCKREAPRYEPDLPICNGASATMDSMYIKEPSKGIANGAQPYANFWKQFRKYYANAAPTSVAKLLEDIDYQEGLILEVAPREDPDLPNDFSTLIEASATIVNHDDKRQPNGLPPTLAIFFERNGQDGPLDKDGVASITIRSNPVLPDLGKGPYDLIGFVLNPVKVNKNSIENCLIAFIQKDQEWYFYNNDPTKKYSTQAAIGTKDAMYLASAKGTIFFYRKIT